MTETKIKSAGQEGLTWHQLTGPEFEEALRGKFNDEYKRLTHAWLECPKLKYFMHRSALVRSEDTRVFFMATKALKRRRGANEAQRHEMRYAVGILEVDFEGSDRKTVGLKYVSVAESVREQGIAKRLYGMLISHLQKKELRLYRTKPGAKTPERFTQAMTRLLGESSVNWYERD